MPGGDRTGPAGLGPMTGRGAGYCAGYAVPGYANPLLGRGYGFGYGRGLGLGFRGGRGGRGWGRWGYPYSPYPAYGYYGYTAPFTVPYGTAPTKEQEIDALQEQAKYFEETLAEIKKRVSALSSEKSIK